MIRCIVVINQQAKPRLVRFYDGTSNEEQQTLVKSLHGIVSSRPHELCSCFIHSPKFVGENFKIVYRHFATLYFIAVVDSTESELGMLDLIQVFVQVLDACFENVCELDLIYHFEKVNYILDEIVMGGLVVETHVDSILAALGGVWKSEKASTSGFF
eukprot:Lankesteria_metandrocarpae@DN3740_c0_g1_i1.p1